jgi:serine/threonine protein kinase
VHRDLTLRNILLKANFTVKIADFGLSRQTRNRYYSRCGDKATPLFWTAPEALKSSKVLLESDWWTFGVILWELFELGGIPYADVSEKDLVEYLENGNRLEQPRYSPMEMFVLFSFPSRSK